MHHRDLSKQQTFNRQLWQLLGHEFVLKQNLSTIFLRHAKVFATNKSVLASKCNSRIIESYLCWASLEAAAGNLKGIVLLVICLMEMLDHRDIASRPKIRSHLRFRLSLPSPLSSYGIETYRYLL